MTKHNLLLIALILALIFNALLHFAHPAYQAYERKKAELDDRYDVFVRRVSTEVIPMFFASQTNLQTRLSLNIVSNNMQSVVFKSEQKPEYITARYMVVSGQPYLSMGGHVFALGEDLYGSRILDIRPTFVVTSVRNYLIKEDENNVSD